MPHRSHPESANTPGCRALNMASSRWARRIRSRSGPSSMVSRSVNPRTAAMMLAVVQAMPLVVKIRL